MGKALPTNVSVTDVFERSRENFEQMLNYFGSEEVCRMKHSDLERELMAKSQELMRKLLQDHLDLRGPGEAADKVIDKRDIEHTHKKEHDRKLETVFGTVEVHRAGYGGKGLESLHPLDAELNLPPERFSHELRRRAAEEASKGSFDEVVYTLNRYTGARISKRQAEELVYRAAQDFDAFYEIREVTQQANSATGAILVITSDGKGVVMREEDLREATRKAAQKRKRKLQTRLTKGEKPNAKRMATVASVYTIAPFVRTPEQVIARRLAPVNKKQNKQRPRPEGKRVWASLEKEPEEVLDDAFCEATKRDTSHSKRWVALVDGAKPQLLILKKLSRKHGVKLTIIVDLIHVIEYLWKAGVAFHEEASSELETWVQKRILYILKGRGSHVAAGMRRSATLRQLTAKQRESVDKCANYLITHKAYLKYDKYLAAGFPIATGVIEGACRHLVKDRMALTGARWRLAGAEAVLRLRALRASKDFDEYWRFHEAREYERHHAASYVGGKAPGIIKPTVSSKHPRLKLVK